MHEKMHVKLKINEKERVIWHTGLGRGKTSKNLVENDKKLRIVLVRIGERKKKFEKVLKK